MEVQEPSSEYATDNDVGHLANKKIRDLRTDGDHPPISVSETMVGSSQGCDTGIEIEVVDVNVHKGIGVDDIKLVEQAFNSPVGKAAACVFGNLESCGEVAEEPRVGMVFCSWEDVEAHYKSYGKRVGFGISRAGCGRKKNHVQRTSMTWRCEHYGDPDRKGGKKLSKSNDGSDGKKRVRSSKKCFCTAMLYASINDEGNWVIKNVVLDHANHNPTPSKSKLVKEYRMQSFSRNVRRRLLSDVEVGVPIPKIHSSLARERDGLKNMPFTEKDLRHVVDKERRLKMEGGDANALVAYFDRMQRDNMNFFHSHRLDSTGHMQDIIWVDARSRVAYDEFGDVVCFDSTYLTNDYELPFINFVGVNHHGQSILFGCALVSHEDSDTIAWVLRQWLLCMKGKAPQGILTDQAASFRKPIEEIMPNTRHRWCLWHILQKLPRKLGAMERYQDFKEELLDVVYDSISPAAFESGWKDVIAKFELVDNEWLSALFEERIMWSPAYMKDTFWAGMRTTQRVESINSFFDQFINRHTTLCEFGERYCAAIEKRICQERDADARGDKWVRKVSTGFKMERIFRKLYTDAMFRKVQIECERLAYCYVREEINIAENKIRYIMEDRVWVTPKGYTEAVVTDTRMMIGVDFNPKTREAVCDCKYFETTGILCRHLIQVFDMNLVYPIPEKYILRRWRKGIPRKHSRINIAYHDHSKTEYVKRWDKMTVDFEALCDLAAEDEDATAMVGSFIRDSKNIIMEFLKNKQSTQPAEALPDMHTTHENSMDAFTKSGTVEAEMDFNLMETPASTRQSATNQSNTSIKDPPIKKKRGRPRTTCTLSQDDKARHKNVKDCDGTIVKGKGKAKTASGKKKSKEKVASSIYPEAHPSKLSVMCGPKSVSFSNEVDSTCIGSESDEFLCRNSVVFEDDTQT